MILKVWIYILKAVAVLGVVDNVKNLLFYAAAGCFMTTGCE